MALLLLAFLGGILTIISPCILPVLPFVFSRADQPFRRSGLPLLAGMALTFAGLAALATAGGGWIVRANEYGRVASLVVLAFFGLTLLLPALADWISRPFVKLGSNMLGDQASSSNSESSPSIVRSLLLGVATGLLWAPCAGPILGLVLTGAALEGTNVSTVFLLLAYALGAAISLAVALLAGGRVFAALKRSLKAEVWIRSILGAAVLAGVAVIAFGLDRGLLTKLSLASTSEVEQSLVDRLHPSVEQKQPAMMMMSSNAAGGASGPQTLPDLSGAVAWLNSPPLNRDELKGKVVLIDFWTYSCINCLRTLPYIRAWADKYKDSGLVVIGVHTPEFAFEKDQDNVRRAVREFSVTYPVALDNDYKIWKAFSNSYWPADYLIDATGKVRYHHFGEGKYAESEQQIQALLKERNGRLSTGGLVAVAGSGAEAPPDTDVESFETYLGYERAENFMSPGGAVHDSPHLYTVPKHLELNQWGLSGRWTDRAQVASLEPSTGKESLPGKIVFQFHARDVHLVLGPDASGKPIRFRVKIDGKVPGADHGIDTDEQGNGKVIEYRLYQLIRQRGTIEDHTFEIEFLDPGAQAFAFTFG
jgi:cytochrome c biogenesis protein CcdA/thiol-disulfide isomerase/thioredoxin